MSKTENMTVLEASWEAFSKGDMDGLAAMYSEDMKFILPGQNDVLEGRDNFRAALDGIADALPPGFDVKGLHYFEGDSGIVNVVEWTADKVPDGSQSAIRWKFDSDSKICEERWFIDTEQWKAAF